MFSFIRKLFQPQNVDASASKLAEIFTRHVTVPQIRNARLVANTERTILGIATGEKRKENWSGAATARFSNKFAWDLIERGYPKDEVLQLSKRLTVSLLTKPGKSDKPQV